MPGFISTHTHSAHTIFRGGPEEGKDLYQWLEQVIFPGLKRTSRKQIYNSVRLWHREAIRAGITSLLDSSDYGSLKRIHQPTLKAHEESGMRVIYGLYFFDKNPFSLDIPLEKTKSIIQKIESLIKKYQKHKRITICPSPGEPQLVTKQGLIRSLKLAKKYDVPITLHVSETKKDSKIDNMSTIEYLEKIGFLNKRVLLAHCVWINDKEIELIRKSKVKVAHNPTANGFLADGLMPLSKLKNITVGIGMDDANCNSNVNMLSNLKFMCLIQKSKELDSKAITAKQALRMATIEAAKAIGMEKEIGSIEEGKKADIIIIELTNPQQKPLRDPYFGLVYQCYGNEISHSIINGKLIWKKNG